MKTILCFGDSNTYGYNPHTKERFDPAVRWTGRLQRALGSGYAVIEEGCNGRTACYIDENEPWKLGLPYLLPCLNSHKPMDLMILMLGTIDLKTFYRPDGERITEAVGNYIRETRAFSERKGLPVPGILLVAPPALGEDITGSSPFSGEFDEKSREISLELSAKYRKIAEETGVYFLDGGGAAEFSGADSLHLDAEGHRAFAEAVETIIRKEIFRQL